MTASAWTEERVERLKTWWLEGRTADQIAHELGSGISRSAVLGKVHRLGLSAGRLSRRAKAEPRPTPRAALPEPTRQPVAPPVPAAPTHGLATLISVRRCQCRWPIGEPGAATFKLCGRKVARGAFCEPHAAIGYRKRQTARDDLERLVRLG